jgi:phenylalanyl-tRNA synthetase beta chain
MGEALRLFQELAGAKLAGDVIDNSQVADRVWVHPPVPVTTEFINTRLGLELSAGDMQTLLENVEFNVGVDGDKLTVTAPFWRADIESREDVVEEVGRLYGFDHLPLVLPRRSIRPVAKDALLERKKAVRGNLVKSGANELLTYSFVHGNLLDKVGQDKARAFSLSNALSPDLQYYRLSLTPSLLEKVHPNIKAGYDEFALFELGKTHMLGEWDAHDQGVPNEDDHVALVVACSDRLKTSGAPYYRARRYLAQLDSQLASELVPMQEFDLSTDERGSQLVAPYDPKRSALIVREGQIWGVVGEFKASVLRALKLPRYTAGFEVHLDVLRTSETAYRPLPRFPKITQDITLQVTSETSYRAVYDCVTRTLDEHVNEQMIAGIEPLGAYQPEAHGPKNLSFRISAANYEKTMREEELSQLLEAIAAAAQDQLHANRI